MVKVIEQNGKKKEEIKKGVKAEDTSVKKEKKERKVYDLPGQKRDPPEEVCLPFYYKCSRSKYCMPILCFCGGFVWISVWKDRKNGPKFVFV